MFRNHLLAACAFSALVCMAPDDAAASGGTASQPDTATKPDTAAAPASANEATTTERPPEGSGEANEQNLAAYKAALKAAADGVRPEPGEGEKVYRVVGEYRDKYTNVIHLARSLVALTDERHEQLKVSGGAGAVADEEAPEDAVDESEPAQQARAQARDAMPVDDAVVQDGADGPGSPLAEDAKGKGLSMSGAPSVLTGGRRGRGAAPKAGK